jgi:CheY-like chemotaxis protein
VRWLLQGRPEWQIIAEAADGAEAVQKAEELKPDLILLDISLPNLNGIEAALRIGRLSPGSKILFLSQNHDLDVVKAALSTSALGYVLKTHAQSELVPAVDAALRGKQFVSGSLEGWELTEPPRGNAPHHHEILFHRDDACLLDGFTRFIAAALKTGNAAIALLTKSHQESLRQRLEAESVDVDGAIQQGTLILLDLADTLAALLVDGSPDPIRFLEEARRLIEAASKAAKTERPHVAFCCECKGYLWVQGDREAAIRLERACNELGKTHEVDMLCSYPFSGFQNEKDEAALQSICGEHSAVRPQ